MKEIVALLIWATCSLAAPSIGPYQLPEPTVTTVAPIPHEVYGVPNVNPSTTSPVEHSTLTISPVSVLPSDNEISTVSPTVSVVHSTPIAPPSLPTHGHVLPSVPVVSGYFPFSSLIQPPPPIVIPSGVPFLTNSELCNFQAILHPTSETFHQVGVHPGSINISGVEVATHIPNLIPPAPPLPILPNVPNWLWVPSTPTPGPIISSPHTEYGVPLPSGSHFSV